MPGAAASITSWRASRAPTSACAGTSARKRVTHSGCNLFHFATPRSVAALDLWAQVEADRKRPWRIVRRLGLGTLLRYLSGRLTLVEAIAHLGRLAGLDAAAVASPFGLAAVDVDKPADLDLVRTLIART